jgi:hypothetical protein
MLQTAASIKDQNKVSGRQLRTPDKRSSNLQIAHAVHFTKGLDQL